MIDLTTTPRTRYGNRSLNHVWTEGVGDDGKALVFELTTTHDADRKQLRFYATRLLLSRDNGFVVREYQPFRDIVRLGGVPCARYSAKALDTAAAVALATLMDNADAPEVTRLLEREAGE